MENTRTSHQETIVKKVVLHNQLATEEAFKKALEQQQKAKEIGIPVRLGNILYQNDVLSEKDLYFLDRYLSIKFKYLSTPLPFWMRFDFLQSPHMNEALQEHPDLYETSYEELERLQSQLEEIGISMSPAEILLHQDEILPEVLRSILPEEPSSSDPERPSEEELFRSDELDVDFHTEKEQTLGELAVNHELLTKKQVVDSLRIQKVLQEEGLSLKIGEIFVEKGFTTREAVLNLISMQKVLREEDIENILGEEDMLNMESNGNTLIGKIAVEEDILTVDQLANALRLQRQLQSCGIDRHLGYIFQEKGFATEEEIKELLRIQEERRS